MFHELYLSTEQTRLRQEELRRNAGQFHPETGDARRSPVLAAVGKQLVNFGERLQQTAHDPAQPALNLQTKRA